MKNLKILFSNLLPYWVVSKVQQKRRDNRSFINGYLSYLATNVSSIHYKNANGFSSVVSVQGFGYSGSGAVLDLLREYDDVFVVGHVDKEGSATQNVGLGYEVDFLRMAGGLLEIERYLGCHNIFQADALLHRFTLMIQNSQIYRSIPESRPYFYNFFSEICTINCSTSPKYQYYNAYLRHDSKVILMLNELTITEYRKLCEKLINTILSLFKTSKKMGGVIVLDQLFSDMEFDLEQDKQYIPNLKTIVVYRDPRDIFYFARKDKVEWIPWKVENFIDWYKRLIQNFDVAEKTVYLSIRFEDLVLQYEETVHRIEDYLNISSNSHIGIRSCFKPSLSAQNIGIWKSDIKNFEEYQKIELELKQLCN